MELYFDFIWPSVPDDDVEVLASQDLEFDDVRDYPRPVALTRLEAVEIEAAQAEAVARWAAAKDWAPFGQKANGYAVCDASGTCLIDHYECGL